MASLLFWFFSLLFSVSLSSSRLNAVNQMIITRERRDTQNKKDTKGDERDDDEKTTKETRTRRSETT